MGIEHIRLTTAARDQLVTLKRRTGIAHWNILCRWALCRSLAEPAPPPAAKLVFDSNVEMTWRVFAGEYGDELLALVRYRCHIDGLGTDDDIVSNQLRLHLHRGIGYLVGDPRVTNIAGFVSVALDQPPAA
ncbi:DNA sulfur modification protein DndE [Mycobacteroides abscessus]|uniref:DNA sulfur modification protein DndE n=1 Tax=Mycobacteroides abscessus TaxID=36809 RepID=A0ABD7HHC7_9MYCO|nr:DNA sulfur modification protein DndE [Mycobacteroides abscessus]RIT29559.1 DNA sulfur modification protein DndE [Mycobacteroides abscessus]